MIFDDGQILHQAFGQGAVLDHFDTQLVSKRVDHHDSQESGFFDDLLTVGHFRHSDRSDTVVIKTASAASDEEPIVIIGTRAGAGGAAGSGGGGSDSGRNFSLDMPGDGAGGDATDTPDAKDTPCVETTFTTPGATLEAANNAALAASNSIAALNDETFEFSSIVYFSNGVMGFTAPWTNNLTDEVNWVGGLGSVPTGAVIVGIVHNHPDDPVMTDTFPSGGSQDGQDWSSYDQLVNFNNDSNPQNLPRGITVDQNMLLYIYTNEDNKTHVYDNTDKNESQTSCSLQ